LEVVLSRIQKMSKRPIEEEEEWAEEELESGTPEIRAARQSRIAIAAEVHSLLERILASIDEVLGQENIERKTPLDTYQLDVLSARLAENMGVLVDIIATRIAEKELPTDKPMSAAYTIRAVQELRRLRGIVVHILSMDVSDIGWAHIDEISKFREVLLSLMQVVSDFKAKSNWNELQQMVNVLPEEMHDIVTKRFGHTQRLFPSINPVTQVLTLAPLTGDEIVVEPGHVHNVLDRAVASDGSQYMLVHIKKTRVQRQSFFVLGYNKDRVLVVRFKLKPEDYDFDVQDLETEIAAPVRLFAFGTDYVIVAIGINDRGDDFPLNTLARFSLMVVKLDIKLDSSSPWYKSDPLTHRDWTTRSSIKLKVKPDFANADTYLDTDGVTLLLYEEYMEPKLFCGTNDGTVYFIGATGVFSFRFGINPADGRMSSREKKEIDRDVKRDPELNCIAVETVLETQISKTAIRGAFDRLAILAEHPLAPGEEFMLDKKDRSDLLVYNIPKIDFGAANALTQDEYAATKANNQFERTMMTPINPAIYHLRLLVDANGDAIVMRFHGQNPNFVAGLPNQVGAFLCSTDGKCYQAGYFPAPAEYGAVVLLKTGDISIMYAMGYATGTVERHLIVIPKPRSFPRDAFGHYSNNKLAASPMSKPTYPCIVCDKPTTLGCSACLQVAYCCGNCQDSNKFEHSKICEPTALATKNALALTSAAVGAPMRFEMSETIRTKFINENDPLFRLYVFLNYDFILKELKRSIKPETSDSMSAKQFLRQGVRIRYEFLLVAKGAKISESRWPKFKKEDINYWAQPRKNEERLPHRAVLAIGFPEDKRLAEIAFFDMLSGGTSYRTDPEMSQAVLYRVLSWDYSTEPGDSHIAELVNTINQNFKMYNADDKFMVSESDFSYMYGSIKFKRFAEVGYNTKGVRNVWMGREFRPLSEIVSQDYSNPNSLDRQFKNPVSWLRNYEVENFRAFVKDRLKIVDFPEAVPLPVVLRVDLTDDPEREDRAKLRLLPADYGTQRRSTATLAEREESESGSASGSGSGSGSDKDTSPAAAAAESAPRPSRRGSMKNALSSIIPKSSPKQ
jgi:hypothetical protein